MSEESGKIIDDSARVSEDSGKVSKGSMKVSQGLAKVTEGVSSAKVSEKSGKITDGSAKVSKCSEKITDDSARVSEDLGKVSKDSEKVSEGLAKVTDDAGSAKVFKDYGKITDDSARVSGDSGKVSMDSLKVSEGSTKVTDGAGSAKMSKDSVKITDGSARVSEESGKVTKDSEKAGKADEKVDEKGSANPQVHTDEDCNEDIEKLIILVSRLSLEQAREALKRAIRNSAVSRHVIDIYLHSQAIPPNCVKFRSIPAHTTVDEVKRAFTNAGYAVDRCFLSMTTTEGLLVLQFKEDCKAESLRSFGHLRINNFVYKVMKPGQEDKPLVFMCSSNPLRPSAGDVLDYLANKDIQVWEGPLNWNMPNLRPSFVLSNKKKAAQLCRDKQIVIDSHPVKFVFL